MEPGVIVFAGVREGMEPFRYETATIWYDFDVDYHRYIFKVRVNNLPNEVFAHKVDEMKFIEAGNPIHVFDEIRAAAFVFFRTLYVKPESHIQLGEN